MSMAYSSMLSSDEDEDSKVTEESLHLHYTCTLSGDEELQDAISGDDCSFGQPKNTSTPRSGNPKRKRLNDDGGACGGPDDIPRPGIHAQRSGPSSPALCGSGPGTPRPSGSGTSHRPEKGTLPRSRSETPTPREGLGSFHEKSLHKAPSAETVQKELSLTSKIDILTTETLKIVSSLKKIDENQKNTERKIDQVMKLLNSEGKKEAKKQKVVVPAQIAQSIRDGYQHGVTEGELVWKTKNETGNMLKYNSAVNNDVTTAIIEFVKGQYPNEEEGIIREGIKTYFESFKAKQRRQESGKQEEHNRKMAVYSRMRRKLNNRRKALKDKSSLDKEQKEKMMNALLIDYMSSEQTDSEDESSFVIRPLHWRSDDYNNFIQKLDKKHENSLNKRSKRQHNTRKKGAISSREKPVVRSGNEWVFKP